MAMAFMKLTKAFLKTNHKKIKQLTRGAETNRRRLLIQTEAKALDFLPRSKRKPAKILLLYKGVTLILLLLPL